MSTAFNQSAFTPPRLSDAAIARRKELLGFTPDDEARLSDFRPVAETFIDVAIGEFYDQQMDVPEVRALINETALLARLRRSQHEYMIGLFGGVYDASYTEDRLRIGAAHARVGVTHALFVPSLHRMESIITRHALNHGADHALLASLRKLFMFDLQMVFDTYIQGLISEVEESRDRLAAHAETLEEKVAERTAEILHMARTDPLTGLWNRREFYQRLRHEAAGARRGMHKLSVAFLDINEFKEVNDTKGHLHGDKLLRQVGLAISQVVRETDQAFRFGGDEFCLILPYTDAPGAEKLCAVLRAAMPDEVSISCGVAELNPEDTGSFESLVTRADDRMYAAKAAFQSARDTA
jgi:diguanylate cyclase